MSQQYPGQPPGGPMPPGYGSANPPQGMPMQQPGGLAMAPKSNRLWLGLGIGCGSIVLLGIGAAAAAVFWLKARTSETLEELQKLQSSAVPAITSGGELSGDCKPAYACCKLIAEKSTAGDAALKACEVFKTAGYPPATCTAALTGYRKAAEALAIRCE